MGRLFGFLIVVMLAGAGAYYAASPWLAFDSLRAAAEAGDADALGAMIDEAAVREGLKGQVDSEVTKAARAAAKVGFTPVEVAGKAGSMWGDRKVKKQIRPERLADLTAGDERLSYITPDIVRVRVARPPRAPSTFIMQRSGLFGWKVTKIVLPGEKG